MPFIKSFSINTAKQNPFPFNIAAVKFAKEISVDKKVTIFVGDNGCGKSTLLESIAYSINLPSIGGFKGASAGFEAARLLKPYLEIEWAREVKKGFFFRAEDFSDFIDSVEKTKGKIASDLSELKGKVDDSIIEKMSESMNYSLHQMRKDYGENMQAFSHGEAYLKILQTRILDKGIYLLDEPEAALSPLKQLSLIAFIMEVLKNGNTQFIIATHSPILMGIKGACLYEIQDESMQQVEYKETDHYRITKRFLDNPDSVLAASAITSLTKEYLIKLSIQMKSILIETANNEELKMVKAFIKEHKMKGFIVEDSKTTQNDLLNDLIRILIPLA